MKKTEYLKEVESLRLSEEFKESLKKKMLSEYEKNGGEAVGSPITVTPGGNKKKIYRWAAVAACLILAVSTVSVLSVKGLKSANEADAANGAQESNILSAPAYLPEAADEADEPEAYSDDAEVGSEVDNAIADDAGEAPANDEDENTVLGEIFDEPEAPADEPADEPQAKEQSQAEEDQDGEPEQVYSAYASPKYEGDFNGDDYVNRDLGTPDGKPDAAITSEITSHPIEIRGRSLDGQPVAETPAASSEAETEDTPVEAPAAPSEGGAVPSDYAPAQGSEMPVEAPVPESAAEEETTPVEAPAPAPEASAEEETTPESSAAEAETETAPVESYTPPIEGGYAPVPSGANTAPAQGAEAPDEAPVEDTDEESAEVAGDVPAEAPVPGPEGYDICTGTTAEKEFADYADLRHRKLEGNRMQLGLIRFEIVKAYKVWELEDVADIITVDPNAETLYRIKITYDYLGSQVLSVETLMRAEGTKYVQEEGRPVMEGEYIALVTRYDDGSVFTLYDELIYKVINVGGQDIAYHLTSKLGNNVDPGDTNMGIDPSETKVYTTSANNPETYVHKSAVNELTRYLKRNIMRLDPNTVDFTSVIEPPAAGLTATYQGGSLRITLAGESEPCFPDPDGRIKAILESLGADIGEKSCNVITKGNKAVFENGELTGLDITSRSGPLDLDIRGVKLGDSIEDSFARLKIKGVRVERSVTVTLVSAPEDGGWTAQLLYSDGLLAEIKIKMGE